MPKCQVQAAPPFREPCQNTVPAKDMPYLHLTVNGMTMKLRVAVCDIHLPLLFRMGSDHHRGEKVLLNITEDK
jgi:hypothetical protein